MQTPKIIIIRKGPLDQLICTGSTVLAILGVIGVGVYFQSAAMQWAGFVLVFLHALAVGFGTTPRTLSIAEAREYLNEIEAEAK